MVGIRSYGAHIPRFRLDRNVMQLALLFLGFGPLRGEKAVANWDEDSITMAVAAAKDCLTGENKDKVDGMYFATTSQTYALRQNAGIVAAALDLNTNCRAADFTDSTKSGTAALLAAADAISAKSLKSCLVSAGDCRVCKIGGNGDYTYGDGAASFLLGTDDVIATIEGSYSTSHDFVDRRRLEGERLEHMWEERFIRDAGYMKYIPEAVTGLVKKYNLNLKDFSKVIYACAFTGAHAALARTLGLAPEQVQDPLLMTVGDTGVAQPLMMLVAALEDAKPGDKIMVVSFGQGCDAFYLTVTDNITKIKDKKGMKRNLANKVPLGSYEKYLAFRKLMPVEIGIRGEEMLFTSFSIVSRENREIYGMVGNKCKKCGTPAWPFQRICPNPDCQETDQMEPYRFADKLGNIFTYTSDFLAPSIDPPASYGFVDMEGGGRCSVDFTDCDPNALKVGMPIELTFRIKYADEKRAAVNYGWKAMPVVA
ncbi:MAG: OB-fold domain-containing protein [Dehalococcoidia bacterium]|nr:OB-fold domain-containing protein [Dehalococcoidia bacterium]